MEKDFFIFWENFSWDTLHQLEKQVGQNCIVIENMGKCHSKSTLKNEEVKIIINYKTKFAVKSKVKTN